MKILNIAPRLFQQVGRAGLWIALTVIFCLAGGVLTIFWAKILSRIVFEVFLEKEGLWDIRIHVLVFIVLILARAVFALGSETAAGSVATKIKMTLRSELFDHLLALGPAYVRREQSGELTSVLFDGVESTDAYFSQYLPQLIVATALPVMILWVVFPLDWVTALVLLLTAPLIPIFMILIGKAGEALMRRQFTSLGRMSAYFLDTLQGLTTLKLLDQSYARIERISAISDRYRKTTMKVLRVTFISAFALELIATISTAIVAVEIGLRLLYGQLGFEQAFFVLLIAPEFYLPLRLLGTRFHAGMSGAVAAERIFEILEHPLSLPAKMEIQGKRRDYLEQFNSQQHDGINIRFEDITYSYPQRDLAALNHVSFEVQSGCPSALVGPSGAGKSTIFQILLRFIDPQSGEVYINEIPMSVIPADIWRQKIAWVPQRPHLFNDTLAANIAPGCRGAAVEEIRKAAQLAHLDEFVDTLPDGYKTLIGEGGARLSSGQAQRVALARAYFRNAPLLLMDEPTAHLDPHLDELLHSASARLCLGRTALLITHRLPTVFQAERIIVLDNGDVVQTGTHTKLLATPGVYRRLVEAFGGVG